MAESELPWWLGFVAVLAGAAIILGNRALGAREERRLGPQVARTVGMTPVGRRGNYPSLVGSGVVFVVAGVLLVLSRGST